MIKYKCMNVSSRPKSISYFLNLLKLNWLLIVLLLFSCQPPPQDGHAPGSANPIPTVPSQVNLNYVKYGQSVTTSAGWVIQYDDSDVVEAKTLTSGWKIEVKYE